MDIENHMVLQDRAYDNEMSNQEWYPEEETCPMCNGEQHIALRCKCGNMPELGEDLCEDCGATAHFKTCPCCLGKGVIYG